MLYDTYGTSARVLENEPISVKPYEESEKLKRIRRQREIRAKKMKAKVVIGIISFGLITFLMILQNAMINDQFNRLNSLRKEYENIKNEVDLLRIQIEKQVDLSKVEEVAYGKLGMQKPDRSQIVYINVNEKDICEVIEDESKVQVALNSIMQKIQSVLEYLY
ncbi:MAG: hypothetical protein GX196_04805 [Clostridiaceae bacterium]|nr:hypothetical protein [Clostridiaceae bacterium]